MIARLIQSFRKWKTVYLMAKFFYNIDYENISEACFILTRMLNAIREMDEHVQQEREREALGTSIKYYKGPRVIPEHLKFTPPAGLSPEEQLKARKAHIMAQTTISKPKQFVGLCNDRLVTGYEQESENSWWAYYHGRQGELITIGRFPTEQEAKEATRALFTHVDECIKTFKSIVDANDGGK
jgi:hypothetical protein